MKQYDGIKDEELISRFKNGESEILDYLMEKYKNMVRKKARTMFLIGGENDDLIQEGMIGLFKAVRDYQPDRDAAFQTFASICADRQIYNAIQSSNRQKHQPLNSYISLSEQDGEVDRRYLITQKGAQPKYLLPVRFLDGNTGYEAFAPREYVRIKKKGGGLNFVHGGISLQEMVVPVLEFQFLRNSYKAYQRNRDKIDTKPVTVSLLSASRKISNMIFSLNFYQKEAVGGNREAAQYLVYFVDENGQKISDTGKIIADKTSDNAQERTFRCNFSLRSQKYSNRQTYFLVIADESGLQAPVKEEFQIDIAFAVDDFNFF